MVFTRFHCVSLATCQKTYVWFQDEPELDKTSDYEAEIRPW
jgi:hypothetical protein